MKKPMLRLVGGWAVFLSVFCFYLSTVVIRWSQAEVSIAPSYFVFARFLLGLLVVCAIMVYRRQRPRPRSYHLLLGRTVCNSMIYLNVSRQYHDTNTILFFMFGLGALLLFGANAVLAIRRSRQE